MPPAALDHPPPPQPLPYPPPHTHASRHEQSQRPASFINMDPLAALSENEINVKRLLQRCDLFATQAEGMTPAMTTTKEPEIATATLPAVTRVNILKYYGYVRFIMKQVQDAMMDKEHRNDVALNARMKGYLANASRLKDVIVAMNETLGDQDNDDRGTKAAKKANNRNIILTEQEMSSSVFTSTSTSASSTATRHRLRNDIDDFDPQSMPVSVPNRNCADTDTGTGGLGSIVNQSMNVDRAEPSSTLPGTGNLLPLLSSKKRVLDNDMKQQLFGRHHQPLQQRHRARDDRDRLVGELRRHGLMQDDAKDENRGDLVVDGHNDEPSHNDDDDDNEDDDENDDDDDDDYHAEQGLSSGPLDAEAQAAWNERIQQDMFKMMHEHVEALRATNQAIENIVEDDVKAIDVTQSAMMSNLQRLSHVTKRLQAFGRRSCSSTWMLIGLLCCVVVSFFGMVLLIRIVPKRH